MMKSAEIRKQFLDFFERNGHKIVASAPMVVKDDPTLMFNNSGMAPFKDLFLGNSPIKYPRVADTQKCLRVSGKHNDLEEVGVDTYHHTMFEMLGNWSFGDYFKKEAITWAWELLTEIYKIDKSRLYVTVFEGSDDDQLGFDQEAYDIWKQFVPEERILRGNKKDNFWEMGEVGPCGPCSEIHYDGRSDEERTAIPGADLVNMDNPQVIEIWNNVFMEFERRADGSLVKLPKQHVDTGMGFERLVRVLQGKQSNYDTDIFMPIINKIEDLSGLKYKPVDEDKHKQALVVNIAMRVIADHIRAISFSIADGQLPSNSGAGYVIRRILRRAIRYGYQSLGLKDPFMHRLVHVLATQMGEAFPELVAQKSLIEKVIKEEEISFFRTLETGLKRIDQVCITLNSEGKKIVPGKVVFELYDTFGFPLDLTHLIARGYEMEIDEKEFNEELEKQKTRSRKDAEQETGDWVILKEDEVEEFIGYDFLESDIFITRYRELVVKGKPVYQLVFNLTPFYPEGGGQVGDKGVILANGQTYTIFDTKKENNLILHYTDKLPNEMQVKFKALVDESKRKATTYNHSATHLLHAALREVLGTHVEQKGSLVNEKVLRFDFSHFSKVTEEEIIKVEQIVNEKIRLNQSLEEFRSVPLDNAREMGAMMLFGEKYGEVVRVIKFGNSLELCGGTHVRSTSEIGNFKLISEGSVAAGIRRVEAITADAADQYIKNQLDVLGELTTLLKNPKDLVKAVQDLLEEKQTLEKYLEEIKKAQVNQLATQLAGSLEQISGINYISTYLKLEGGAVKDLVYQLKSRIDNLIVVVGSEFEDKALLTVLISDNLVKERNLHAGNMVKELAREIEGGGGGQPFFATAGGKNPKGLKAALEKARKFLN
jgi:alanyl-tRNA synthetase